MSAPGLYLMNASGELTPLVTEDGGGDRNLLDEVVNDEVAADTDLELVSADYKLAHERSRALTINDAYGEGSADPFVKFNAAKSSFSLTRGLAYGRGNNRSWEKSVSVRDPDAARELAAHLLSWADYKESADG